MVGRSQPVVEEKMAEAEVPVAVAVASLGTQLALQDVEVRVANAVGEKPVDLLVILMAEAAAASLEFVPYDDIWHLKLEDARVHSSLKGEEQQFLTAGEKRPK